MKNFTLSFCGLALALILCVQGTVSAAPSSDRDVIEALCRQMEEAYGSLDLGATVDLYYDLEPRGVRILMRLFEVSRSLNLELEFSEINPAKTEAIVLMRRLNLVHKYSRRKLEARPHQEMYLRKIGGSWKFVTPEFARTHEAAPRI